MNKIKMYELAKSLARVCFFIFFALSFFNFGTIYGKYSTEGQSLISFATEKREHKFSLLEGMPENLKQEVNDYNKVHNSLLFAVVFSLLIMFFDYFIDPENHFFTIIKNKLKPILNNMKED